MPIKGSKVKKKRRTYAQLFMDELNRSSNGQQRLIPNQELRNKLNWETDKYERVKAQLIDQGKLVVGKGRGGTVGLAIAPGTEPLKIFISYSHADEEIKLALEKHLQPLKRLQLVKDWSDRKITPGKEWDKVISGQLEKADIILLLVSVDFINSTYCYDIEMERAIERHANGEAIVIPIIIRSCIWQHAPFAKLQALPKDAKAIALWHDRDEALVNVIEGIHQAAEQRLSNT